MIRSPIAVGTLALLLGLAASSAEAAPAKKAAAKKKAPVSKKAPAQDAPVDPYGPSEAPPAPTPDAPVNPYPSDPSSGPTKTAPTNPGAPANPDAPTNPTSTAPSAKAPETPPATGTVTSAPSSSSSPTSVPSAPAPTASADPAEAQLAEEIAFSVASRAQELLDAKQYVDAKQLAVEAIARSPRGVAAERAQLIIRAANTGLGIPNPEDPPIPEPGTDEPASDPKDEPAVTLSAEDRSASRPYALVHGGLYGGLIGATLGGLADDSAGVEAVVGAAGAAAGAYFLPRLLTRYSVEQVRTIGSASVWGGAIGGLLADVTTGLASTSPRQVLIGATLGSTAATAGGLYLARRRTFTRGDVALIDTLTSIGAAGGLTLGLAMQPVESEGYSLNAVLGATAGIVTGFVAAPQTETTQRRMLRVAGGAAAGGAAPWLVYLAFADSETNNDEQVFGLLSTAGLLVGAYFGLRWTRGMDAGKDVHDIHGAPLTVDDSPPALLRRSSRGQLAFGSLGMRTTAAAPQTAYVFDVLAGRF
jgi:hypothetical protein